MNDPLHPPVTVLIKLGSALVHAEEAVAEVQRGGYAAALQFDIPAFESVRRDAEVEEWMLAMAEMAFLPVKRSDP